MAKPETLATILAGETKDPRTIITPHAFSVAPHLLYTPLAAPWKRAFAILIDTLFITVLAAEAGMIFVALVLLTSYLGRFDGRTGKFAKFGMYLLMSVVLIYALVAHFRAQVELNPTSSALSAVDSVTVLPQVITLSQCQDAHCANTEALALANSLSQLPLSQEDALMLVTEPLSELPITSEDKRAIEAASKAVLSGLPADTVLAESSSTQAQSSPQSRPQSELSPAQGEVDHGSGVSGEGISAKDWVINTDSAISDAEVKANPYSPLEWLKGLLNDLGLGFGWAAFYFTVFITWFDGQTLGKKLLGIRVICLDGSKFTLWGAFCRYGGYGAGFATGLIGFLQIFWDANRQAIQDKISATVVIDLTKPKEVSESTVSEATQSDPK